MVCLKFCCICMNKNDLKHLFDVDNDGVSHYNKLISSIAEMNFKEMNDQRLICGECCITLNTVYNFRQTCLRSKTNLITYLSQLQTSSHVMDTTKNSIKDERESENEENNSLKEMHHRSEFQSSKENFTNLPSVKEECDNEVPSFSFVNTDHVNESFYRGDKVEDVKHQTMVKDEHFTKFDIEEHPLVAVKDEPMSDTETPQDGSTIQLDSGSEFKKITNKVYADEEDPLAVVKDEPMSDSLTIQNGNTKKKHRTHSKERAFKCEICNESFAKISTFTRHKIIHTDERPYVCEICNKTFNQQTTLKVHKKLHTDKRPYKCEICNESFKQNNILTRHKQIHTGEKPYKCEICNESFHQRCNLTRHKIVHSGEKPYECEICKKSFNLKSTLNRHRIVHSGDRPYKCELCHRSFNQHSILNRHKKLKHADRS